MILDWPNVKIMFFIKCLTKSLNIEYLEIIDFDESIFENAGFGEI